MDFFNSGLFWLIEGVFLCLVILGMKTWMEDAGIPMRLWKWTLFGVWLLLFSFTLGFIGTSLGENEINAAIRGGALFGIITIITGAGLWKLLKVGTAAEKQETS